MARKVKVRAVKYVLGTGAETQVGYRFVTKPEKVVSPDEAYALIAERMGSNPEIAEAWLKGGMRTFIEQMMNGNAVNNGFMVGKLHVKGSTDSATGQPAKGSVEGVVNFTGDVRDAFAALEVVNDSKMVEASLLSLQQAGEDALNRLSAANVEVYCTGNMLYIDPAREDEGVWLLDLQGRVVAKCALVSSTTTSVVFRTPAELPEDGQYKVMIQTRNGESEDEYTVATLTRLVTVEAAA